MGEIKNDLARSFRQSQEKYTYYIVALNVTAIGYVSQQTYGEIFRSSYLLLMLAIVAWLFSAFKGLEFVQLTLSNLYENHRYLERKEFSNVIDFEIEKIEDGMSKSDVTAGKHFKWMNFYLIIGVVMYFIWRIVEMNFPCQ